MMNLSFLSLLRKRVVTSLLITSLVFSSLPLSYAESTYNTTNENSVSSVLPKDKSNIIIYDNGVSIDGNFYTQNQFENLLHKSVKVNSNGPTTRNALAAGLYFIPGIGEVLITVTGVIIIGGTVIAAGTWLYNTIVNWFEQKSVEEDYQKDKENGAPTDNHSSQSGSSLPTQGDKNSSKDLKDEKGDTKQRRYYDKDGNADMDIDYSHGGVGHKFPHRHYWKNGIRGSEVPF